MTTRGLGHWFSLIALLMTFPLAGCSSAPTQHFHSGMDPGAELAIVEVAPDLEVVSVDDNDRWSGRSTAARPLTFSFPEGQHNVFIRIKREEQEGQMIVHQIRTTESEALSIDGYFRAGRVYRIGFRENGTTWKPTLQDVTPPT